LNIGLEEMTKKNSNYSMGLKIRRTDSGELEALMVLLEIFLKMCFIYSSNHVDRRTNPMFIVLLKFSGNKGQASQFMEDHNEWIKRGFDDGVFLLVGSLQPNLGGGIVAHNTSLPDLQNRVNSDPFVAANVVSAEILEITPSKTDERLQFLLG
jgi:uncharacterized protein YciI